MPVQAADAIKVFSRKPDFIWRKMGCEAVLFNPATSETYLLNPTAAAIWELLDGGHSVEDIAEAIAEKFDAERMEILKDIVEFISEGNKIGYINSE